MLRSARRPGFVGKFVKVALVAVLVLILVSAGVLAYWVLGAYGPDARAEVAFEQSEGAGDWYEFGEGNVGDVGVVLYPGARVEAEAYAPAAKRLSEESGVLVAVVRSPLDVALLDTDAAEEVFQAHPEVERWVVGGHSLGGVAASSFADDNPEVDGLLLWASYPAGSADLSDDELEAVSLYGSRDEVLDLSSLEEAKGRLPRSTQYVEVRGMNHAQFGSYGAQEGDGEARISDKRATREVVVASTPLIDRVEGR